MELHHQLPCTSYSGVSQHRLLFCNDTNLTIASRQTHGGTLPERARRAPNINVRHVDPRIFVLKKCSRTTGREAFLGDPYYYHFFTRVLQLLRLSAGVRSHFKTLKKHQKAHLKAIFPDFGKYCKRWEKTGQAYYSPAYMTDQYHSQGISKAMADHRKHRGFSLLRVDRGNDKGARRKHLKKQPEENVDCTTRGCPALARLLESARKEDSPCV